MPTTPSDHLVDPWSITDHHRSDGGLEAFFLFCTAVANKAAPVISGKLQMFLDGSGLAGTPFEQVRNMLGEGTLYDHLKRVRMGKYGILVRGWQHVTELPVDFLRKAGVDDLEKVPGVGPKTARFFLVHSREYAEHAVIDTHMLKFLRDAGEAGVPTGNFPGAGNYAYLESLVLGHVRRLGLTPADFDLQAWSWYAKGNLGLPPFASRTPS